MTIHVSLPKELEKQVHAQVESGHYSSASEVVREALRKFFFGGDVISRDEAEHIRKIVAPRMEAVMSGKAKLRSVDEVFDEIEKELMNLPE